MSLNDFVTRKYLDFFSHLNIKLTVLHLILAIIAVLVHDIQPSLIFGSCKVLEIQSIRLLHEILIGYSIHLRRETLLIAGGLREVHLQGLLLARLLFALLGGDRLLPILERLFLALLDLRSQVLPGDAARLPFSLMSIILLRFLFIIINDPFER